MTNFSTENNGPEFGGGTGCDESVFVEALLNLGAASTADFSLLVTLLSLRDEFLIDNVLGLVTLEFGFCVLDKLLPLDITGVENFTLGVYKLLRANFDPRIGFPWEPMPGVPRCSNNELQTGRELSNDGKGFLVS